MDQIINNERVPLSAEDEAEFIARSNANAESALEARRMLAIKNESDLRIARIFIPRATSPVDKIKLYEKELNGMMQNAKLDNIVIGGGSLTAEQQATKATFEVMEATITDIRAMSDLAETNMDPIETYVSALDAKGY